MVDRNFSLDDSDSIAVRLIQAIQQDSTITSSDFLTQEAIRDNLPALCRTVVRAIAEHNVDFMVIAEVDGEQKHGVNRLAQNFTLEEITREFFLLKKIIIERLKPQLLERSVTEAIDSMALVDLIINRIMDNCFESYAAARQVQVEALHQQIYFTNQEIRRLVVDHQDNLEYLAHEIKNPLTSIIGYSDLYLRQQKEYAATTNNLKHIKQVLQQGRNALRIVNDSVELAEYQQGNFKLKVGRIEICTLLEDIVLSLKSDVEAKNIHLITACNPENLVIKTDYLRLQQIVTNLLTNAIRYTIAGTIEVICNRVEENLLEIKVADTGVGIAPQHRDRVFEPRFRSNLSQQNVPEGVGLGLAIVSQLVDILGGNIKLDSELGMGSTFTVQIPVIICK
ncbi:MAG: sensor histidine kinase [Cyanobacteria bacterium J06623_7]